MRLAYAITQDLPLADEVDQDSFLRVYRRINQFDDERTFSPWFNRMLYVKSPGILRPQTRLLNCSALEARPTAMIPALAIAWLRSMQ